MLKFAENLKYYRKSISVTQSAFAEILNEKLKEMELAIDYNNKSISMWEKGDRFPDSPLVWVALAKIMNVSLDQMMLEDISNLGSPIVVKNDLKAELCSSHMKSVCSGDFATFNSKSIVMDIDEYLGGDLYHGMFYVLSSVKSVNGYQQKYNIESLKATSDYIRNLRRIQFCNERSFVSDIIANGGSKGVFTSERISDVWDGFFDCLKTVEEFDTKSMYDDDKNHILTIVEYNAHIKRENFEQALNLRGNDLERAIAKLIIRNKKFYLGVRMARDLIK